MPAVAQSAVTINEVWKTSAPRAVKCVDADVVLASQGGLTNSIGASLFGMSFIDEVEMPRTSASLGYLAAPSFDRTKVCIYDLTQSTDASRSTPADVTATLRMLIKGKE